MNNHNADSTPSTSSCDQLMFYWPADNLSVATSRFDDPAFSDPRNVEEWVGLKTMQNNGKNATLCPVAFLHRASIREFHLSCSSSSCCSSSSSIPPHVSTLIHWNSIVFSPDRRGPGCSTTRIQPPRWSGWSSEARWTCPRRWLGSRWTCRSRTAKHRQGGQQRQGKRTGQSCSTYPKVNLKHIHDSLSFPFTYFPL